MVRAGGPTLSCLLCDNPKHSPGLCRVTFYGFTIEQAKQAVMSQGHRPQPVRRIFEATDYSRCVAECYACDAVMSQDPVNGLLYGSMFYGICYPARGIVR